MQQLGFYLLCYIQWTYHLPQYFSCDNILLSHMYIILNAHRLFSEKDIVRRALTETNDGKGIGRITAADIMTPKSKLLSVSPTDSTWDLMKFFTDHHFRAAPVISGNKLVGMVSVQAAANQLVQDHRAELVSLNSYIGGSY